MTQMLRNAVAHGIEPPDERARLGKDPCGTVRIRARQDGGFVVVEVSDDGRGLDRERLVARATEMGILAPGTRLSPEAATQLLFAPGLSTADEVSDLAGRGVGMDIVRRTIESLHGTIDTTSVPGAGTTFVIRVPLTLAIVEGLCVGVDDDVFVVPVDSVQECFALPASVQTRDATGVLPMRDVPTPFVRLRAWSRADGPPPPRESVIIVRADGRPAGVVVDQLLGTAQVVVKSLGAMFEGVDGIAGGTILGDGKLALILEPGAVVRAVARAASSTHVAAATPHTFPEEAEC